MDAVDTNILLYAHDPRDPGKQRAAAAVIERLTDGALLWEHILDLRTVWSTVLPSWRALERAKDLLDRRSLSFWDAALLGACLEAGILRIYSENFSGLSIEGLQILNPFAP